MKRIVNRPVDKAIKIVVMSEPKKMVNVAFSEGICSGAQAVGALDTARAALPAGDF